jgi:hypothetical protein
MTEENNLNPWFDAKRLLIADYKNGYILNDMDNATTIFFVLIIIGGVVVGLLVSFRYILHQIL